MTIPTTFYRELLLPISSYYFSCYLFFLTFCIALHQIIMFILFVSTLHGGWRLFDISLLHAFDTKTFTRQ